MGRGLNWDSLPGKYRKKSGSGKVYTPLEEKEQEKLAEYLDMIFQDGDWCHVPNEGKHKIQYRAKQKRLGLKSGVPDVLIFKTPEQMECNGIAIELKRQEGGRVTENQELWLERLADNGWITNVCEGADEAISFLEKVFEGE